MRDALTSIGFTALLVLAMMALAVWVNNRNDRPE